MKKCVVVALALSALVAVAEKRPIERYQSIIDRQMFGPLPKDFDPTKMPSDVAKSSSASARELTKEQEQLQSSIHFSVINIERDGRTVVGFTDNSDPKAPVHYYLHVGDSQNGWTVKAADASDATMTIVKNDVEVSLTLGDNSANGGGKTSSAGRSAVAPADGNGAAHGLRRGLLGGSLRERRMRRQAAEAAEAKQREAEAAEKEAARQAQAEQEKAEREAERAQQRQQLLAIQEELRKAREEKDRARSAEGGNGENDSE